MCNKGFNEAFGEKLFNFIKAYSRNPKRVLSISSLIVKEKDVVNPLFVLFT